MVGATRKRSYTNDQSHSSSRKLQEKISGYKIFERGFQCRRYQYKIGKVAKLKRGKEIELCRSGFHFCRTAVECLAYYDISPNHVYAKVTAVGEVKEQKTDLNHFISGKVATNKLVVEEEIPEDEFKKLCTGTVVDCLNESVYTYLDGALHSTDDKPARKSSIASIWYSHGKEYRVFGASYVINAPSYLEAHWHKIPGVMHRKGKPAYIWISDSRAIVVYMECNSRHNEKGPARMEWVFGTSLDVPKPTLYFTLRGGNVEQDCVEWKEGAEEKDNEFSVQNFTALLENAKQSGIFLAVMREHFLRWIHPSQDQVPMALEQKTDS